MQAATNFSSEYRDRTSRYLKTSQVNGTRALPYAVYGGKVYSFKVDYDDARAFGGEHLQIGADGCVYAVFADEIEAEGFERYFVGCDVACVNGYMNAYCLGRAR